MKKRVKNFFRDASGHIETLPVGFFAGCLLAGVILTTSFLALGTVTRFEQIKSEWTSFSEEADEKGVWISQIRGHFGYGGMIHNFKNFVLRRESSYLQELEQEFKLLYQPIDSYIASGPSPEEINALVTIRRTVNRYELKTPIILNAAKANWSAERLDKVVRIDDRQALDGLNLLESIWWQERNDGISSLLDAFSRGEQLNRMAFVGLFVMTILAAMIVSLMHFLIKRTLASADQLTGELAARKKAQEAEKKLGRAVEQSPTTIAITDTNGTIEYVNQKFCNLTGYSKEELLGRNPNVLKSGHTGNLAYEHVWRKLKSGKEWRGIFKNRKKDGSHYWAATSILPLKDEDGSVTNFIGIGEDITDKKAAQEQVIRSQKLEAVGLLAGGIAHDFNNILMVILGNVQIALLEADEAENEEELRHIEIAARRAQGLVKQLLTFARRQPSSPRQINLVQQINEVMVLLKASTVNSITITLDFEEESDQCAIQADPTQLHQILMNLSQNASEAIGTQKGTIKFRLSRVELADNPGLETIPDYAQGIARIDVIDSGPGIPPHLVDKVFDPFYSTKPIGKGTGLGLSVVRSLVEDIGGLIKLDDNSDSGAVISLFFPSVRGADAQEVKRQELVGGREQILLVDDEEDVVFTMRRLLTRLGYRVVAYTNSLNALAEFERSPRSYDLLISDLVMPEMGGEELIHRVQAIRADVPIILSTAYLQNSEAFDGIANLEILQKPVELLALSIAVRKQLDLGRG